MIGLPRRQRNFSRLGPTAAQWPTRWLLAACFATGPADSAIAFQVELNAGGPSHLAVLSINSRTVESDAGCSGRGCGGVKPDAKTDALRVAAATLQGVSAITGTTGAQPVWGTSGINVPSLVRGIKRGNADMPILGGQNKEGSFVLNVSSGLTMRSANIELTGASAISDVLFNIADITGAAWDGVINDGSNWAKRRIPVGLLGESWFGLRESEIVGGKNVRNENDNMPGKRQNERPSEPWSIRSKDF